MAITFIMIMTLFSYIRAKLGLGGVEASNMARGSSVGKMAEVSDAEDLEPKTGAIPFAFGSGVTLETARCRDEAKKLLEAVGDESLLWRADVQLVLVRIFAALRNGDESLDLKDAVACLQKLAALRDVKVPEGEADSASSKGLTPEALAEIERSLRLM
jgi:hypothetical protein